MDREMKVFSLKIINIINFIFILTFYLSFNLHKKIKLENIKIKKVEKMKFNFAEILKR